MIDFLWKLVAYWSLYETARYVTVLIIRSEIGRIANTKSDCPRCKWRLFCVRASLFLRSRFAKNNQMISTTILLTGISLGNLDSIWIMLQKLLQERKALNDRRKEKGVVPRPGLQHRK
jgi:hypothetical protein